MADTNPICFQCGQPSRTDTFNRLPNGRRCSACAERLLATLPAPLPASASITATGSEPEFAGDRELEFDGDLPAA